MLLSYPPVVLVYLIPALLISLSFHELSHAFVSSRLGDPTAKNLGRLSLNPFRHLDVLGTLMILLSGFGWAKPVPINPGYYKDRKRGIILVSLAGPVSNLLIAFIFSFPMIWLEQKYGIPRGSFYQAFTIETVLYDFSSIIFVMSISLAVFNIIPVPPLDGSRLLSVILPPRQYGKLTQYENYIGIIFLILIFAVPGLLGRIMSPLINVVEAVIDFIVAPIVRLLG